jgi:hypothetical protein
LKGREINVSRRDTNIVRPFGGEKVHWTFSSFRLTPVEGEGVLVKASPEADYIKVGTRCVPFNNPQLY